MAKVKLVRISFCHLTYFLLLTFHWFEEPPLVRWAPETFPMRHVNPSVWNLIVFTVIGLIPLLPAQADEGETKSAKTLFHQYCLDCHGPQMDGRGSLRPFLEQDPANLTSQATQAKTDQELFSIIKNGGGVEMHGWADTFTEEQIFSLVRYLRVLAP